MRLIKAFQEDILLMEGALGERLKREFDIRPDEHVALAAHVYDERAKCALETLWNGYMHIAKRFALPFLATTPTRRVNRERVAASRFDSGIVQDNVRFLHDIRRNGQIEMYVGALVGCKGDAYRATDVLSETEAEAFHSWEAELFAANGIDFFFAGIMPALTEAAGMARALSATKKPYIISFMIRRNGRLIDGTPIGEAIAYIDARTDPSPLCYMVNCVHPDILYRGLSLASNRTAQVRERLCGIQTNASPLSPEELDDAQELRASNPERLAQSTMRLCEKIDLKIVGGCCGTNDAYMDAIAREIRKATLMRR